MVGGLIIPLVVIFVLVLIFTIFKYFINKKKHIKMKHLFLFLIIISFTSCISENYSNGERIGTITRFSNKGLYFKSWEGTVNITQTGMNTSGEPFDFSVDSDVTNNQQLIAKIDSAAKEGWKVRVVYHQTMNKNWFRNRGDTNHFINELVVIDKNFSNNNIKNSSTNAGIHDTIYVVIRK